MTDLKISQLDRPVTHTPTGAELMETAIATVDNYQLPLNTVRGIGIGKSMVSSYTPSITNPVSGLGFKIQRIMRPLGPFAPLLQTFEDDFTQDCGFYVYSGNIGTRSFTNGHLSIASTAGSFGNAQVVTSYEKFEFPGFAIAIEGIVPSTDSGVNVFALGISKTGSNNLYAYFEIGSGTQNRITLAKIIGGSFSIITQTGVGSLPSPMTGFAVQFDGNSYICWIQVNNGSWYPVLTTPITDFNLLSPTELANWTPFFEITGGISTPWTLGRLRTGYSGATFFRDYRIVTNKDGTPYVSNGCLYFTCSNNYCSVWRMNVKSGKLEKVGGLTMVRGGSTFFDLNAHIVWDQDINKWRVVWATWGNGPLTAVTLYQATYDGDILNGMHTIAGGTQMTVSQTSGTNATYDASLVFNYATNLWMLAYAYSPSGSFSGNMRTVVDTSPDLTTWTNSWIDNTHLNNEGAWITQVGGNFFVFAGDGTHFNCWSITGTYEGTITTDVPPPSTGNPPSHFIVFPWMDGDITSYYALAWTNIQFQIGGAGIGVFGNGSPILYRASQTEVGFEYNAIGVI